jgi:hypothetical protein
MQSPQHTLAGLLLEAGDEGRLVLCAGLGLDAVEAVVSVGVEELEGPGRLELLREVVSDDFLEAFGARRRSISKHTRNSLAALSSSR